MKIGKLKMKNPDEDIAYGEWKQAKIERDWDSLPITPQSHMKVGTVLPFTKYANKDPWPDVGWRDERNVMPDLQTWEKVFWAIMVGFWVVLVLLNPLGWSW